VLSAQRSQRLSTEKADPVCDAKQVTSSPGENSLSKRSWRSTIKIRSFAVSRLNRCASANASKYSINA